jgi:hypothetical protein
MIPVSIWIQILFLTALVFIGNFIVNAIGLWHYEHTGSEELFDFVHQLLPDLPYETLLTNIVPIGLAVYAVTRADVESIALKFASKILLILLLRSITTIVTILPKYKKCDVDITTPIGLINGGCYEKVFSSHTSVIYVLLMTLFDAGHLSQLVSSLLLGTELFFISLTRSHYTIDILLGLIISFFVYEGDYGFFRNL